jgi:hypothetical protein
MAVPMPKTETDHGYIGLLCILCWNHPQAPGMMSAAKFVVNGLSVCGDHADVAKDSNTFHEARTKLIHGHLRVVK